MKIVTFYFLVLFSFSSFSQSIKNELQGEWICTQIVDTNDQKTSGKFGESDEFLCFIFKKNMLRIQEIPIDYGIIVPVNFEKEQIKLIPGFATWAPNAMDAMPEQSYKVAYRDKSALILETINADKKIIKYHFIRRTKSELSQKFKYGIIIKRVKIDNILYPQYEYLTDDASHQSSGQASFMGTFGQFIAINFKFPKDFLRNELSQPVSVEFTITSKGKMQNLKIVQSFNDTIDSNLLKVIKKTRKKWQPSAMRKPIDETVFRFEFQFYHE